MRVPELLGERGGGVMALLLGEEVEVEASFRNARGSLPLAGEPPGEESRSFPPPKMPPGGVVSFESPLLRGAVTAPLAPPPPKEPNNLGFGPDSLFCLDPEGLGLLPATPIDLNERQSC